MFYAIDSLKTPLEEFVKETNQEDFSINMINGLTKFDINNIDDKYKNDISQVLNYKLTDIKNYNKELYNEIINNRIEAFEKEYKNFNLESREFKEINFKNSGVSNKITLFKDNKDINLSYIEEGSKPVKDDEIAVSKIYAKHNNLNIGSKLKINGKLYTVTGYVLFPDNTLPVSGSDFVIDNSKITIGLVNDKEYENIEAKEDFYLSGEAKDNKDLDNFTDDVTKTYKDNDDLDFITNITLTKNQMRSGAIYEELKGGQAMTIGISVIISTIAVLIVLMITYKIVKNEKTQIGVLKAMGYSNKEILKPYIMLLTIMSLPMLIIGYFLGKYSASFMKDFYLEFYLIPDGVIKSKISVMLIAIGIPMLVIIGLSYILINKMLSKKVTSLMKVSDKEKVGFLTKGLNKLLQNAKPQTKFKYSFILANTNKFIVFFIGIVFSSMLITMGLMMSGFFDKLIVDYYNSTEYVYEGIVDFSKGYPKLKDDQEVFISLPNSMYKDENINVVGIDYNNKLHKLYDNKGNDITNKIKDGVVINQSFAKTYDVNVNDEIKININDKDYNKKVVGINEEYGENKVYMNRSVLNNIVVDGEGEIVLDDGNFYNGVYSKESLDKDDYLTVINKNDILEQTELMQGFTTVSIYSMIASAIGIAVIVLYVLTTMTIEDNYYSISLLKVMGYNKGEVNSMMLSSYFVYSIISYLISIPITIFGFGYMIDYLAKEFNMVMPFEFEFKYMFIGLLIVVVIFMLGSYAAKKKIEKISLQEVLKAYRE
ncbi:ABC transporter permease [Paraclostridium bifermentans]